jgi:hypothetical protein
MESLNNRTWLDFYISDFFYCEKGNQNNMAQLFNGDIPLVSARKCDNGYKDFVSSSKKLFKGHILTLNNDGDGGAGISYYQPYTMALDSHVTALIPKIKLSRHQLLFVAMCITKQRNKFGHGYAINSNRLRSFKLMLPAIVDTNEPDWSFMGQYMLAIELKQLKQATDILCKRLIINTIQLGGVIYTLVGKNFISRMYLQKYNVANDLRKRTNLTVISHMCLQQPLITALMDSLEIMAA